MEHKIKVSFYIISVFMHRSYKPNWEWLCLLLLDSIGMFSFVNLL
jgi:hypothetical protein